MIEAARPKGIDGRAACVATETDPAGIRTARHQGRHNDSSPSRAITTPGPPRTALQAAGKRECGTIVGVPSMSGEATECCATAAHTTPRDPGQKEANLRLLLNLEIPPRFFLRGRSATSSQALPPPVPPRLAH